MRVVRLDNEWTLCSPFIGRKISATVPGCVHTDLIRAGIISDPTLTGDFSAADAVEHHDWLYETEFTAPAEEGRLFLNCEGLDTLAEIRVNEHIAAKTNNMFRLWRPEITALTHSGRNRLSIAFSPKTTHKPASLHPTGDFCELAPHSVRSLRKPTVGIWRPITLQVEKTATISSLSIRQIHEAGEATIHATASLHTEITSEDLRLCATIMHRGVVAAECIAVPDSAGKAELCLTIRNAQYWWPNGMGDQPLYELQIQLFSGRELLQVYSRRIGIRTVRLDQERDKFGERFCFVVNGIPAQIRGTCWRIFDIFPSRPTRVEYARLIKFAKVSNMNMLRVTGDGVYEHDHFYDLCDEYGILVWQDFMFSSAAYPLASSDWLENARTEVRDTISRLGHHPSIALWCGGDNLEKDFVGDEMCDAKMPRSLYREVFYGSFRSICHDLTPDIPYVPSSAPKSTEPVPLAEISAPLCNPQTFFQRPARFYTALGMQSVPNVPTTMHPDSEGEPARQPRQSLPAPAFFHPPINTDALATIRMIQHGILQKAIVEYLRRHPKINHGIILKSLGTPLQPDSGSSLDSEKYSKCLHYFVRRFFNELLVSGIPNPKTGTVDVFVHNDANTTFSGKLRWRIIDTSGRLWREMDRCVEVAAKTVKRLGYLKLNDLMQKISPECLFVWLQMIDNNGLSPSFDCIRFSPPKNIPLKDPKIECEIRKLDDICYTVTLSSERPALWCWLEFSHCAAKFDDNFICIAPGQPVRVRVTPMEHFKQQDFKRGLKVRSLFDTYDHG